MAAPTIKIKRSAVSGNAPTTAQLELGELALNTYDGKLFTEINTGSASIVEIGSNLSTLDVSGAAAFAGAVDIAGATGISGATTYTNDVTFDGATAGRDIVFDRSDNALEFADNAKATWGDGVDLSIYHDGTTSYITNTNGFFRIKGDDIKLEAANGEDMIECDANGAVKLYHNNSYKLATASYGIYVSGKVLASNGADFAGDVKFDGETAGTDIYFDRSENAFEFRDNAKAIFGTGSDLSVYHDGSHSFIDDTGTGNLKVRSNNFRISNADESKIYGTFTPTSVDLYYNNTKRIETSAGGAIVTGGLRATGIVTATHGFSGNINSTGISTISGFTFPSTDGSEDQSLVTDGNGGLSFKTISGGSGATGAGTSLSTGITTATQGQTSFTAPNVFDDGEQATAFSTQVFVNGVKQRLGASNDYQLSAPQTVTLNSGANVGDDVTIVVYFGHTLEEEFFTATQGQITFSLSGSLSSSKNYKVFLNGVRLRNTVDYIATSAVVLNQAAREGEQVDIVSDQAEDRYTANEGQTSFAPADSNTTSTNMQVYMNGILLRKTEDWTIGSPAITMQDVAGLTLGDEVDVVVRRS